MPFSEDVEQLLTMLRQAKRTGKPTELSVRHIARTVGPVLQQPRGQLHQALQDLWTDVQNDPLSAKAFFAIRPFASRSTSGRPRSFNASPEPPKFKSSHDWWLRLLILVAEGYGQTPVIPSSVAPLLRGGQDLSKHAENACKRFYTDNGLSTFADRLTEALVNLRDMVPPIFAIENDYLVYEGVPVGGKLSSQMSTFLRLLIAARGGGVDEDQFKKAGIANPKRIKDYVCHKSELAFLKEHIKGGPKQGYRLIIS
jgi:hypothetical protein